MTARLRAVVAAAALLVGTAACSSGTSTPAEPDPTPVESADPGATRELLASRGIGTVTLQASSEGGSHPVLAWDAVDGAASYWLVLHDDAGRPYWGWTGSETSVRVGGGDRAEQNQTAVLHEPMTWSVSAFDADGRLMAISEPQVVEP